MRKLEAGVHIVSGTPGRVFDMIKRRSLRTRCVAASGVGAGRAARPVAGDGGRCRPLPAVRRRATRLRLAAPAPLFTFPPPAMPHNTVRNIKTLVLDEADEMLNKGGWVGWLAGAGCGRRLLPPAPPCLLRRHAHLAWARAHRLPFACAPPPPRAGFKEQIYDIYRYLPPETQVRPGGSRCSRAASSHRPGSWAAGGQRSTCSLACRCQPAMLVGCHGCLPCCVGAPRVVLVGATPLGRGAHRPPCCPAPVLPPRRWCWSAPRCRTRCWR